MKEKYETPVMDIVAIDEEDIVFASNEQCGSNGSGDPLAAEC